MGECEVGRPSFGRPLRLLRTPLVTVEAVEVVARHEELPGFDVRRAERRALDVHERHLDAIEPVEVRVDHFGV